MEINEEEGMKRQPARRGNVVTGSVGYVEA